MTALAGTASAARWSHENQCEAVAPLVGETGAEVTTEAPGLPDDGVPVPVAGGAGDDGAGDDGTAVRVSVRLGAHGRLAGSGHRRHPAGSVVSGFSLGRRAR